MIEKLDLIQSQADAFEKNKKGLDVLAVAIVSIGYAFNPEVYPLHQKKAEAEEYEPPGSDMLGNEYYPQYMFTCNEEPICMSEYACRIASGPSTHVIQLDMCEPNAFPNWKCDWHEIVLK